MYHYLTSKNNVTIKGYSSNEIRKTPIEHLIIVCQNLIGL